MAREHPTWVGTAEFSGDAAIRQSRFPIEYTITDSSSGDSVILRLGEPFEDEASDLPPMVPRWLRQPIEVKVKAPSDRAVEFAQEAIKTVASVLGFVTRRRIEPRLGPLEAVESTVAEIPVGTQLFPISSVVTPQPHRSAQASIVTGVFSEIGDTTGERGRRVIRSFRWLARSRTAGDEVEAFSVLAMALEALVSLLPEPSDTPEGSEQTDTSTRLRRFATRCGVAEEDWKTVGGLRHALFHGGLLEDEDTLSALSGAIPTLRGVVIDALRTVLKLPDDVPPDDPSDSLGIRMLPPMKRPPETDS